MGTEAHSTQTRLFVRSHIVMTCVAAGGRGQGTEGDHRCTTPARDLTERLTRPERPKGLAGGLRQPLWAPRDARTEHVGHRNSPNSTESEAPEEAQE